VKPIMRSRMSTAVSGQGTGGVRPGNGRGLPRDKARALERLATARANLAGLEQRATPAVEPGMRAAVEQRQQQIEALRQQLRSGKRGRAGKQARQQIEALEGTQRLVVECLGFRSFEEFRAMTARADATRVDRYVLDAARQEVDRAERHFFDTAEMAIPVPTPPTPLPAPRGPYPMAAPTNGRRRAPAPRWAAS
jgi:hypothetical protein